MQTTNRIELNRIINTPTQHLDELVDRANMLYTAEDISAVFDCHPCHVVDLWQLGIIDVADGLLLLYPDFRTPCWVVVNPVLNAAIDEFRRSGELKAVVQARRRSMSGFDTEP